ncbi:MAG: GDSL family lipase [Candidatus Eremiobacteraeota bacterium]|nr:GDSL family lipase [Candidatus Eremiobacteraeota bacterium]
MIDVETRRKAAEKGNRNPRFLILIGLALVLEGGLASALALAQSSSPANVFGSMSPKAAPPWVPQIRPGKNRTLWLARHQHNVEVAKAGNIDLLFLGDSIIDRWTTVGKAVWDEEYAPVNAANFGISGDRTQYLLWRIQNGELEGLSPKLVVILIGTNNLAAAKAEDIARAIGVIVATVRGKLPTSNVLLLGILPRGAKPGDPKRDKINTVNSRIAQLASDPMVHYLDIGKVFLNSDGAISPELMPDYLHPSAKGYQALVDAIRLPVGDLMGF